MQEYIIILRILHIACGVLWAGGIFMLALFIMPAVDASGPEGGKVMRQLAGTNNFPIVMLIAATLNIVAGLLLYWRDSNGLSADYMSSPQGMAISTGMITAIIAYVMGITINRPGTARMAKIGSEIATAGGKPNDGQMAELGRLKNRIFTSTRYMAILLLITVVAMAIARYLY